MGSKIIVNLSKTYAKLRSVTDDKLASDFREVVNDKIKGMISRGISPVEGKGNFPKYKNPKKYPGDLKPSNKPNLYLEGDLMGALTAWLRGDRIYVGIEDSEQEGKADANNRGLRGIPARRFIPLRGERFAQTVMLAFRQAVKKRFGKIF